MDLLFIRFEGNFSNSSMKLELVIRLYRFFIGTVKKIKKTTSSLESSPKGRNPFSES